MYGHYVGGPGPLLEQQFLKSVSSIEELCLKWRQKRQKQGIVQERVMQEMILEEHKTCQARILLDNSF